jgi:uncharacterized membrane protein YdjX (TVP38/TMEM64 family)
MGRHKKEILLLCLLLAVVASAWYFREDLTLQEAKKHRETLHRLVEAHYLLSIAALIGIDLLTAFFLPGALVLTLIGGFLFGVVRGTIYIMAGMTLGASLAFLFSRYLAGNWIQSKYADYLKRLNAEIARYGSNYLIVLRILPALPFFAVNFLAGMTRMSFKRFILTTVAGLLPGCVIYAYAGHQLGRIASIEEILTPKLSAAFLLLGIIALFPVVLRFFSARLPFEKHHEESE